MKLNLLAGVTLLVLGNFLNSAQAQPVTDPCMLSDREHPTYAMSKITQ